MAIYSPDNFSLIDSPMKLLRMVYEAWDKGNARTLKAMLNTLSKPVKTKGIKDKVTPVEANIFEVNLIGEIPKDMSRLRRLFMEAWLSNGGVGI